MTQLTATEVRIALAKRLRTARELPISGELLARELGISRAAVSKHLGALREGGFQLDASPRRGYRLLHWPDTLAPEAVIPLLETQALGHPLRFLAACASTNTLAFTDALEGAPHGHTVVADAQEQGRGRKGRPWHSPPGMGIYVSVVLRPPLPPQSAPPLTLVTAVAVAETLEQSLGLTPRLKWPNDVLLGGRKVCGILLEMSAELDRVAFVVCGIGLNVNTESFPDDLVWPATSLRRELGRTVSRPTLLAALLANLERWTERYVSDGFEPARQAWLSRAAHLGREVRVDGPDGERAGTVESLDLDGALLLRDADGMQRRVLAGDVWPNVMPVDEKPGTR
ncbi:MAG: biotin--[acetyl-CoA-carboxylase] ligase [bacterium]